MNKTLERLVQKKKERLRGLTLLLLCCVAAGLLAGSAAVPTKDGGSGGAVTVELEAGGKELAGFTVALDPGHGGYDGGARARQSGLWEKDINLQIALAVEKALVSRGASVMLTRREDICLCEGSAATKARKRKDLQARMDIAAAAGADVLVSIHLNDYRSRRESGPQVFYQRGGDDGRLLAGALQKALIDCLKPQKERVAMAGDYYVLRSKLPSALVECGFLSNAEEEKLLLDEKYQRRIAQALALGLCEYREMTNRIMR